MKKSIITSVLVAALLVTGLTACGAKTSAESAPKTEDTSVSSVKEPEKEPDTVKPADPVASVADENKENENSAATTDENKDNENSASTADENKENENNTAAPAIVDEFDYDNQHFVFPGYDSSELFDKLVAGGVITDPEKFAGSAIYQRYDDAGCVYFVYLVNRDAKVSFGNAAEVGKTITDEQEDEIWAEWDRVDALIRSGDLPIVDLDGDGIYSGGELNVAIAFQSTWDVNGFVYSGDAVLSAQ